ncbi:MAG: hypothetical protein WD690_10080 [Vicinamibacterales bacterium]
MAKLLAALLALALTTTGTPAPAPILDDQRAATMPNIVLIFPDNLGWGEVGAYGSVRGDITPRLDKMEA